MARRPAQPAAKPKFQLDEWYSSESAKRSLGSICQAVNEQGESIGLLGTERRPYLILEDADESEPNSEEVEITIDEAKADWSAVTAAAALFGTRFRIHGKKLPRAVLYRHPKNAHPALKYRRANSSDMKTITEKLENLLDEVRRLSRSLDMAGDGVLGEIVSRLEKASDIIDRRFRETWRHAQNLPAAAAIHAPH